MLEVSAPKPGNVNRYHDFSDARFEDFLLSAVAIRPAMERAERAQVGEIIWRAICYTRRLVFSNTNLGMVLLLAPLAKACFGAAHTLHPEMDDPAALEALQKSLADVLARLTVEDARRAYAAIRLAQPSGLGKDLQADVANEPTITLFKAMALAQERDAIAREYVTNFAISFGIGYPALKAAWQSSQNLQASIVQAYLTILAQVPDTLIVRKRGVKVARQVSSWAEEVLAMGGALSTQGKRELQELDWKLRDRNHTLNPGTTADLVTAALFLLFILSPPGLSCYRLQVGPQKRKDREYERTASSLSRPGRESGRSRKQSGTGAAMHPKLGFY